MFTLGSIKYPVSCEARVKLKPSKAKNQIEAKSAAATTHTLYL